MTYYSQKWTILRAFKKHKVLWVSFFMKWQYMVWWKAWVRICELVKDWYLKRSPVDTIWSKKQRFANYELTAKWFNTQIPEPTFIEKLLQCEGKIV